MHSTVFLIVKQNSLEDAISFAKDFLNTESGEYDYFEINKDGRTGPLSLYLDFITELAASINADDLARNYLAMAEGALKKGIKDSAAYWYKAAGAMLQRSFSSEIGVYNTEDYSYEVPDDSEGYFVVEVDLHN